jgi:hypothetical protein
MRNGVSFYKQYCRLGPESRRPASWTAWLFIVLGASGVWTRGTRGAELPALPGAPAAALARLFTPVHAPSGAYQVRVVGAGIEEARQAVWKATMAGEASDGATGAQAWRVQELEPLEAFGTAGTYPRTTVARLYTGRRASVVRGPVTRAGRTVAAVTLISPYPDPTLSRLDEGTLIIVLDVSKVDRERD